MDTYDFENKHLYRFRRETVIDRALSIPKIMRKVAYLDTKEALDTISYLNRGYRAENLYAVNNNPAELALLTMKLDSLKMPRVNTVGLDFEEGLDRRIPAVDIIDFDGMGCLSDNLIAMLGRITEKRPNAIYGVTLLGGRESKNIWRAMTVIYRMRSEIEDDKINFHTSFGTQVNPNHASRIFTILSIGLQGNPIPTKDSSEADFNKWEFNSKQCKIHIDRVWWDVYISISNQPICWLICKCSPHHKLTRSEFIKIVKHNHFCVPICCDEASEGIFGSKL